MAVRTLDLFCGGGGSSWGARSAGAEIICGVDAWDLASRTFADNFPEARVLTRQLHQRSNRRLLGDSSDVDLILASPECTNHTCAKGNRERSEESRRTALFVLNFAHSVKPRWIVIENVIQMQDWSGYSHLIRELKKNYKVGIQKLDAANFGVPQQRRRLFILCDREAEPPDLTCDVPKRPSTVPEILDPPGTWPAKPLFESGRAAATIQRARRAMNALGEGTPFLIVYYGTDGAGGWQTLDRPLRTLTTLDRFGLVEWTSKEPTLRMLQVPELKRAMGFDNGFAMRHGTRRDKIKILGNAVSPPVITKILQRMCGHNLESSKPLLQLHRRVKADFDFLDDAAA